MFNFEQAALVAQERHRDLAAESEHDRLTATLGHGRLPFSRRIARPVGRQLLRLSLLLLRYGKVEAQPTAVLYRSTVRSVELN